MSFFLIRSRGVHAMKYRKGDEAIDMEILPGGDGDKEKLTVGKNYVIVVTARGRNIHLWWCMDVFFLTPHTTHMMIHLQGLASV